MTLCKFPALPLPPLSCIRNPGVGKLFSLKASAWTCHLVEWAQTEKGAEAGGFPSPAGHHRTKNGHSCSSIVKQQTFPAVEFLTHGAHNQLRLAWAEGVALALAVPHLHRIMAACVFTSINASFETSGMDTGTLEKQEEDVLTCQLGLQLRARREVLMICSFLYSRSISTCHKSRSVISLACNRSADKDEHRKTTIVVTDARRKLSSSTEHLR